MREAKGRPKARIVFDAAHAASVIDRVTAVLKTAGATKEAAVFRHRAFCSRPSELQALVEEYVELCDEA